MAGATTGHDVNQVIEEIEDLVDPATKVELSVICRNLPDKDVLSKSDPMCFMYSEDPVTGRLSEVGRTELVWNTLNPVFVKKFVVDYHFEETQRLYFKLYDIDSVKHLDDFAKHDFLGEFKCRLSEIVSGNGILHDHLHDKKNPRLKATIKLVSEELNPIRDLITLQFRGHKMDKKDTFGKSDPFLKFSRYNKDTNSYTVVHKTEAKKKTLNPQWEPFTVPIRALCNNDYQRVIKVECYDYDKDGGHDLIGEFTTNLHELLTKPSVGTLGKQFGCIHPKKQKKSKKYINSGTVELLSSKIQSVPTFLDYIQSGTEIQCVIAIDFCPAQFGDTPAVSRRTSEQVNVYVTALEAVGRILQDYDSDKEFPAFGFGAKIPPQGHVSEFFALNGVANNPYCHEVAGVSTAYQKACEKVEPHGPNKLAACVDYTARLAASNQTGQDYFILLILTSGRIADMEDTRAAIVNAAGLPLSVIIVGIGDTDFTDMEILDGDDIRLTSRNRTAVRDIVQFVPFRDHFQNEVKENEVKGKARSPGVKGQVALAKAVLQEIPGQFLSYMRMKGFKPQSNKSE